jgi:hypothetical protein
MTNYKVYRVLSKSFLLIFFLFISCLGLGQINIGVKGGLNLSTLKNGGPENPKLRLGWNAGGFARIIITKKISAQTEILYSIKGYSVQGMQNRGKALVSFKYINLPILLGFQPTKQLRFLIGPEFGFLAKATSKFEGNIYDVDLNDEINNFDIGVDLGIDYSFTKRMGIDIRYNHGFNGLFKSYYYSDPYVTIERDGGGYNRVLQISIYYILSK